MKILTWLLMIGIVGVLLLLGCSASSNSVRFKSKGEQTDKNDPNIRFTSNESKASVVPDSSNIDEISDDNDSEELPNETQSIDISSIMQRIRSEEHTSELQSRQHLVC